VDDLGGGLDLVQRDGFAVALDVEEPAQRLEGADSSLTSAANAS